MRPLWVEFPSDPSTFQIDDAWMVGSELLVKPVTDRGVQSVSVSFPGNGVWYDILTLQSYAAPSTHQIDAPLVRGVMFSAHHPCILKPHGV